VAEPVVGEEGASPPRPVAAEVESVEARVLDEPAAVARELAVPEMVAKATTSEIQVAEETGTSLSQAALGGEARTLELACTSWVATSGLDADSEDEKEAAARHTLERAMIWARRPFDELILPTTTVGFLVRDSFLIPQSSRAMLVNSVLLVVDPRVFRSETHPRGAPTPRGADPAGDAACRSSGSGSQCRGERDVRAGCRMDLPGPTTSVGTRTDYSVGPWDYPACATRHLKAWSTRTTQE
jgi:hypothetical protein